MNIVTLTSLAMLWAPLTPGVPQSSGPASAVENPKPEGTPAARAEKPQMLVLDLEHSADVSVDATRTLTGLVTTGLANIDVFRVVSGSDLRQLAALEADRSAMGCDDTTCLAELAGAMGARFVVFGRLSKLGDVFVLQLSLFDAVQGQPIHRLVERSDSLGTFAEGVDAMAAALAEKAMAAVPELAGGRVDAVAEPAEPRAESPGKPGPKPAAASPRLVPPQQLPDEPGGSEETSSAPPARGSADAPPAEASPVSSLTGPERESPIVDEGAESGLPWISISVLTAGAGILLVGAFATGTGALASGVTFAQFANRSLEVGERTQWGWGNLAASVATGAAAVVLVLGLVVMGTGAVAWVFE